MKQNIKSTIHKNFTLIEFSNPPANTFTIDFLLQLINALNKIDRNKALIITAKGNIFSAGLDLFFIENLSTIKFKYLISLFELFIYKIVSHPFPSYTILNGHAIAGGFILSSSTDICISNNMEYKVGLNQKLLDFSLPSLPRSILKFKYNENIDFFYSTKKISAIIKKTNTIKIKENPLKYIINQLKNFDKDLISSKKNNLNNINSYLKKNGVQHNKDFFNGWFSSKATKSRKKYLNKLKTKI